MRLRYYIILLALLAVFFVCACAPATGHPEELTLIGGSDGPTAVWIGGVTG